MKRDDPTNRETTGLEVLEVGRVPVKAWTRGVPVEDQAREQLRNVTSLPRATSAVRSAAGGLVVA